MTTEISHGFVLWAVPRFHRNVLQDHAGQSKMTPQKPQAQQANSLLETAKINSVLDFSPDKGLRPIA